MRSGPADPDGRWLALLGALAIAAPRLVTAACSDPFFDERTVMDLARMALGGCLPSGGVPWDQPPLANLGLYALEPLGRALGLDADLALDVPLLAGRTLVVLGVVAGWLLLRRGLRPGLPRVAFFGISLLSAASAELCSLAMNNGFVVLPVVVALACFGGVGPGGRTGWAAGGLALGLAVAVAWIAWPAALGLGAGAALVLWRRRAEEGRRPWAELALALGPAVAVGLGWLLFTLVHADYLGPKVQHYRPSSGWEPLALVHQASSWFLFGRELHWLSPPSASAKALAAAAGLALLGLAVVGTVAGRREPGWARLGPLVVGLTWGTWVAVLLLTPVVWLGKVKYFLMLLPPTALLASRGLGLLMQGRRRARVAGIAAAALVAAALLAGLVRQPLCWDRSYQARRFYYPVPPAWSCEQAWVPSLVLDQEAERTLLPAIGRIVCPDGGPCPQGEASE